MKNLIDFFIKENPSFILAVLVMKSWILINKLFFFFNLRHFFNKIALVLQLSLIRNQGNIHHPGGSANKAADIGCYVPGKISVNETFLALTGSKDWSLLLKPYFFMCQIGLWVCGTWALRSEVASSSLESPFVCAPSHGFSYLQSTRVQNY